MYPTMARVGRNKAWTGGIAVGGALDGDMTKARWIEEGKRSDPQKQA